MNIGDNVEDKGGNFIQKEVYMGKCAYKVLAVNPNKDQLKAMNQYVPDEEPVYIGKREIDGKEYNLANVTIYLQNISNFDIVDRVTYTVVDNVQESKTGKLSVINKYGSDSWLEQSHIDAKTMPENMQWYVNEGVRTARRGEKELVRFVRALRNFNKIDLKSTPEDRDKFPSQFAEEDFQKMFKGDFKDIRALLTSNPDNAKVVMMLGARTADSGKVYQDMFKEMPMRAFMANSTNNDYLAKEITDAQENGRYSNTVFDLSDFKYKKYSEGMSVQPDMTDANIFEPAGEFNPMSDEDNDLPF